MTDGGEICGYPNLRLIFSFDFFNLRFRMSREEFIKLCEQLRPCITLNAHLQITGHCPL